MWDGNRTLYKRNKAIIALLFFTGMTRSEIAVLKWEDVDLMTGLITIRNAKGGMSHQVVIAGCNAFLALQEWYERCAINRRYIFCRIGKNDKLGEDKPINAATIYNVAKQTQQVTNVTFSPHDARKTFAREALAMGATVIDIKDQFGLKSAAGLVLYLHDN